MAKPIEFSRWRGLRDGPRVDADGQSNRAGVFVAGDLADAPLIRTAIWSGWRVGRDAAKGLSPGGGTDVLIVGAGPAGIAAALSVRVAGLSLRIVDADTSLSTLKRFPAGKYLYTDPHELKTPFGLPLEDGPTEQVVEALDGAHELDVERGTLIGLDGHDGSFSACFDHETIACQRVIVAVGRRGKPRTLNVPGADSPRVHSSLDDPRKYAGQPILVVGGGDSAVEAALDLAEAGAQVTLSYRGSTLNRPRPVNQRRLEKLPTGLTLALGTEVTSLQDGATLSDGQQVSFEHAFVLIGTEAPNAFLKSIGLRLQSDEPIRQKLGVMVFIGLVWLFYLLKTGRAYFPLGPSMDWVRQAMTIDIPGIGTRGPGFWGTALYSALIAVFGVLAMRRYKSREQTWRYLSLITFQLLFLFAIPELLAPMLIAGSDLFAFSVPWPLRIDSLTHGPSAWPWAVLGALTSFVFIPLFVWRFNEKFCSWMCGCGGLAETLGDRWRWRAPRGRSARKLERAGRWILLAAIPVTLLILNDVWKLVGHTTWLDTTVTVNEGVPTVVQEVDETHGHMSLNATVEDGQLALRVEKFDWDDTWKPTGWIGESTRDGVGFWPTKVEEGYYTLSLEDGTYTFAASSSPLTSTRHFAQGWYSLMVDFWLASILGVALYPLLGNRIWCRFFCPLRAYMEILSKAFGRLAIVADETCISCGECTRYCQMGIDVEGFAVQAAAFDNTNSACIQCGICVEVCPMDVLTLEAKTEPLKPAAARW